MHERSSTLIDRSWLIVAYRPRGLDRYSNLEGVDIKHPGACGFSRGIRIIIEHRMEESQQGPGSRGIYTKNGHWMNYVYQEHPFTM